MGEVITNLKAKFAVESQNVSKGLKPGEDALADLDRKVGRTIDNLKGMLTPLALLGAAGGALATFKGAIESIEGPGDRLTAVIGGMKESMFEAGRALATLDFTDFIENLNVGYERGKRLAELLDEFEDRAAYNDYRINQLSRESSELQEILKNKTLEISVRAEAAAKIQELETAIRDRRVQLAREEFEIQKELWEGRNKMETDQALALYESIDAMAPEIKERLQTAFTDAMAGSLGVDAVKYSVGIVTKGLYSYDKTLYQEVPQEVIDSYAEYFKLVQDGERDVLIKLFNTYKQIEETGYRAQEEYNMTVSQTTRLLAQEQKAIEATADAKEKAAAKELEDLKKANAINREFKMSIYLPDAKPLITGLKEVKNEIVQITNEIGDAINEGLGRAMEGFAMWLGEFAVGAASGGDLVRMIGSTFGDMLIQLGKVAVATGMGLAAIQKAFESMNPVVALVAGGALIALGSAIRASVSSIGDSISTGSSGGFASGGNYLYDNRSSMYDKPVEVVVTGEFLLRNNVLLAAIEKEQRRRRVTT
jgi:hypothetical protein